jgi:hypothetical protein
MLGGALLCQEHSDSICPMKIFAVCAPLKSVSTAAFLPSHLKRLKNAEKDDMELSL